MWWLRTTWWHRFTVRPSRKRWSSLDEARNRVESLDGFGGQIICALQALQANQRGATGKETGTRRSFGHCSLFLSLSESLSNLMPWFAHVKLYIEMLVAAQAKNILSQPKHKSFLGFKRFLASAVGRLSFFRFAVIKLSKTDHAWVVRCQVSQQLVQHWLQRPGRNSWRSSRHDWEGLSIWTFSSVFLLQDDSLT